LIIQAALEVAGLTADTPTCLEPFSSGDCWPEEAKAVAESVIPLHDEAAAVADMPELDAALERLRNSA
jgi:hypothetical protein